MRRLLNARTCAIGVLVALTLTGCASDARREAAWVDPGLGAQSRFLDGQRVLVACATDDSTLRQICQQQLTAGLAAHRAIPLTLPATSLALNDHSFEEQLSAGASAMGAKALMVVSLGVASTGSVGSGVSIGIGGFSFGRGGSGAGIGISAPLGGYSVSTALSANAQVTEAQTRRPVWAVTMVSSPSADLGAQVAGLSTSLVQQAKAAGLLN